jgi:hypothetical protein
MSSDGFVRLVTHNLFIPAMFWRESLWIYKDTRHCLAYYKCNYYFYMFPILLSQLSYFE